LPQHYDLVGNNPPHFNPAPCLHRTYSGSWRGIGSSGGQSCFHCFSPPGLDLLRYPSAQVNGVSLLIWSDIVSVFVFDDLIISFHLDVYGLAFTLIHKAEGCCRQLYLNITLIPPFFKVWLLADLLPATNLLCCKLEAKKIQGKCKIRSEL